MRGYFEYARDNDLFVSYVIQNPQANRAAGAADQPNAHLVASVVDEDSGGITVRGAKMLGTSAIMSNEIFAANIQPLKPGEECYALSFAVPIGTRGVKLMSRKSYEAHSGNGFDYPLSARFDENDAVVYFDDVRVPWERVFVFKDVRMAHAQWHDTPAHVFQNYQSQIRLMVKLRFLVGIARKIAETIGTIDMPPVRSALGHLAAQASMVEGLVAGMEAQGEYRGRYFVPSRHLLYAAQVVTQEIYPHVINAMRDLAGGGTIMLPSSAADFANPEIRRLIEGAILSPVTDSLGRVRLFRLAWDSIGSEFASRHVQYEMFYAGASFVTRGHAYRTFDWNAALAMVERMLAAQGTPPLAGVERAA
jgi:4-hydroxyphenylacetate 3-monooxygenase